MTSVPKFAGGNARSLDELLSEIQNTHKSKTISQGLKDKIIARCAPMAANSMNAATSAGSVGTSNNNGTIVGQEICF